MGTVQSNQKGNQEGTSNLNSFRLDISIDTPVNVHLKQLLDWSLPQVRRLYQSFMSLKLPMLINSSDFCRLMPFSHKTSLSIFSAYAGKQELIVMVQFLSILILCAYGHYTSKLHLLYLFFDVYDQNEISFKHFILLLKMMIVGFCKLTSQQIITCSALQRYFKILFMKSDLNRQSTLELKEMIDWIDSYPPFKQVFVKFQPPRKIREHYSIFRPYQDINQRNFNKNLQFLQKIYKSDRYLLDLGLAFSSQYKDQDKKHIVTHYPKILSPQRPLQLNHSLNKNWLPARETLLLGSLRMRDASLKNTSLKRSTLSKSLKKKFNMIIVKQLTLSKKQIFSLREYFDSLSNKKFALTVTDFCQAFNSNQKVPNMRGIAVSLYNFLDKFQTGKVNFYQFLTRLFPSLSKKQLIQIRGWVSQYEKIFSREYKKTRQTNESNKVKVLPRSCMLRIHEIFNSFDQQKKGWISLQNLKSNMNFSFSEKEVQEHFKTYDSGTKGKLEIHDFVRLLLPSDYVIDTKEDED